MGAVAVALFGGPPRRRPTTVPPAVPRPALVQYVEFLVDFQARVNQFLRRVRVTLAECDLAQLREYIRHAAALAGGPKSRQALVQPPHSGCQVALRRCRQAQFVQCIGAAQAERQARAPDQRFFQERRCLIIARLAVGDCPQPSLAERAVLLHQDSQRWQYMY
jgi:hypothetical protein